MKGKPIKIDWAELEAAFNNRDEELDYYLDLVTGQVVLEGEGEGEAYDEEEEVEDVAALRSDTTRVAIEPPGLAEELVWMEEFLRDTDGLQAETAARLREALQRENAGAFRDVLRGDDEARDRWFIYRSDRVREAIEAWLDAHGIRPANPPPWRT